VRIDALEILATQTKSSAHSHVTDLSPRVHDIKKRKSNRVMLFKLKFLISTPTQRSTNMWDAFMLYIILYVGYNSNL